MAGHLPTHLELHHEFVNEDVAPVHLIFARFFTKVTRLKNWQRYTSINEGLISKAAHQTCSGSLKSWMENGQLISTSVCVSLLLWVAKSPALLFRSALILASTPKDIHLSIHIKNSLRSTGTAGIFPPWRPFHITLVKCPDLTTSSLRQLWHWSFVPVLSKDCSRRFRFHACQEEAKNHIQWSHNTSIGWYPRWALLFPEFGNLQVLVERPFESINIWWRFNHLQPMLYDLPSFSPLVIPMRLPCGPPWSNLYCNFCVSISEAKQPAKAHIMMA